MPPHETAGFVNTAVYWENRKVTSNYGDNRFADPIELDCRWEQRRTMGKDAQGKRVMLDAVVIVDRLIPVGSLMWQGEIADWYGTGSGSSTDIEVMEVATYDEVGDSKGRFFYREIGLKKMNSGRPPVG